MLHQKSVGLFLSHAHAFHAALTHEHRHVLCNRDNRHTEVIAYRYCRHKKKVLNLTPSTLRHRCVRPCLVRLCITDTNDWLPTMVPRRCRVRTHNRREQERRSDARHTHPLFSLTLPLIYARSATIRNPQLLCSRSSSLVQGSFEIFPLFLLLQHRQSQARKALFATSEASR